MDQLGRTLPVKGQEPQERAQRGGRLLQRNRLAPAPPPGEVLENLPASKPREHKVAARLLPLRD